jgi:hypothetical protein
MDEFALFENGAIVAVSDLTGSWVGPELLPNADNSGYAGAAPAGKDGKVPQVTYVGLCRWPEADLALLGWKKIVDQAPVYDEATNTLARGEPVAIAGVPTRQYTVTPLPLADLKAGRSAEVDTLLSAKAAAGVAIAGVPAPVQMRDGDRANIDGQALRAGLAKQGVLAWDATTVWRLADNSSYALATPDAMIAFADAAGGAYLALRKRAWAIKDAIAALNDGAAIVAYDVTAGW